MKSVKEQVLEDKKAAILIVDDEVILLMSIRQQLKLRFGASFIYETAISAEKGLEKIDELTSQGVSLVLVISDWLMPGMKGDVFLKVVHDQHPAVKLLMISGHADKEDVERLNRETQLFGFLRKPYNSAALFTMVESALKEADAS
jgi:DNA-binding NtrC family response regulator